MSQTIAFIGLGNMGGGMAANLLKNGFAVRAFDLSEEALAKAERAGAIRCASAAEAVTGSDAVVTMLPAGKNGFGKLNNLQSSKKTKSKLPLDKKPIYRYNLAINDISVSA